MTMKSPIPSLTDTFTVMSAGTMIVQEVLAPNVADSAMAVGFSAIGR